MDNLAVGRGHGHGRFDGVVLNVYSHLKQVLIHFRDYLVKDC